MALRYLKDSGTTRKFLSSLSPLNAISLVYAILGSSRRFLTSLFLPSATSLIYATWMDARQGLVSTTHRAYDITRRLLSWEFSLSHILSCIFHAATEVGRQATILLLRMDRSFGDAKYRMAQGMRRLRRAGPLPTSIQDVHDRSLVPHDDPGLRLRVWNL